MIENVEGESWVSWFCNLKGHDFFCEIDDDYIVDEFNLCGLSSVIPRYEAALDTILDVEPSDEYEVDDERDIEKAAEILYGLAHARYILTTKGLNKMRRKFMNNGFGQCPRVSCNGQAVVPTSESDIPRVDKVKIFCPSCQQIYYPKSFRHGSIDGAYFGTTFAHVFFLIFPDLRPTSAPAPYLFQLY